MNATSSSADRFRILVTDRFDAAALARLQANQRLSVTAAPTLSDAADLARAQGLVVRSRTKITRDLLARAPALKVVVTATSGFDHIDLKACVERGVKVMYTPDANAASAAELTWSLVLAAARKLTAADRAVRAEDWNREPLMGTELAGKTYGLVGLGRIGTRVARIAQAFDLKTVAYDPYRDAEHFTRNGCERVGLDELLKLSDVVSCHVPATAETHHLLTRNLILQANPGLIFVNTSRGSAIAEATLIEGLEKGRIAVCGLDVFESEPLAKDSALAKLAGVVLSPHIGASTHEAFKAASFDAADKIAAFAMQGAVSDELPGSEPWMSEPSAF